MRLAASGRLVGGLLAAVAGRFDDRLDLAALPGFLGEDSLQPLRRSLAADPRLLGLDIGGLVGIASSLAGIASGPIGACGLIGAGRGKILLAMDAVGRIFAAVAGLVRRPLMGLLFLG
ncbi:MAG TPA: hypothetical protein VFL77_07570 [Solirubrobacterales bacterium]|nr:hypothetical protein [Solirubrobacterales bacterium]